MHLPILAWLYVTFAMALTMKSALAGFALFAMLGLAPLMIGVLLAARRGRARRERPETPTAAGSMRERDVHPGDDADAERDQ